MLIPHVTNAFDQRFMGGGGGQQQREDLENIKAKSLILDRPLSSQLWPIFLKAPNAMRLILW